MTTIKITDDQPCTITISVLEDGSALLTAQSDGVTTSESLLSPSKAREVIAALQQAVDEVELRDPAPCASCNTRTRGHIRGTAWCGSESCEEDIEARFGRPGQTDVKSPGQR